MSLLSLAILALVGLLLAAFGLFWRRQFLIGIGMIAGTFGTAVFILKWAMLGFPKF